MSELSDADLAAIEARAEGRCGYEVTTLDGEYEPCDRPATGWRWYEDCGHEAMLDAACDLHSNAGGFRIASLTAELADARLLEHDLTATLTDAGLPPSEHGGVRGAVLLLVGLWRGERQRADEAEAELAQLREHTLDSNPALRTLHSHAVAYLDAVAALSEVRDGAPLSTTLGWMIRQGYLVPATGERP